MGKKQHNFTVLFISLALAVIMCFAAAFLVFADVDPGVTGGVEDQVVDSAITKILETPVGTNIQAVTFTFDIFRKSFDDDTSVKTSMPKVKNGAVSVTYPDSNQIDMTLSPGITSHVLETESLFGDVDWPSAGKYTYTIAEQENTHTPHKGIPRSGIKTWSDGKETITYSGASYDVSVYVKEHSKEYMNANSGSKLLYVYAIGALKTKNDKGEDSDDEKVVSTPGGDDEHDYSQLIFRNQYGNNNGNLEISQTIDGEGEIVDTSVAFVFTITITKPEIAFEHDDDFYKAYLIDDGSVVAEIPNIVVTPGDFIRDDGENQYIEFTTAKPVKVSLKNGQKLSFIDLPVGSKVQAEEQGVANFKISYKLTFGDNAGVVFTAPDYGTAFGFPYGDVDDSAADPTDKYIRDKEIDETPFTNIAAFTNTKKDFPITGLSVDVFPHLMFIVVVIGAIVINITLRLCKKSHILKK